MPLVVPAAFSEAFPGIVGLGAPDPVAPVPPCTTGSVSAQSPIEKRPAFRQLVRHRFRQAIA